MITLTIPTRERVDLVDITDAVRKVIQKAAVTSGQVTVYVPHTTCGITINENCDPDVVRDLKFGLERMVPYAAGYHHSEGNADSHIKTALVGSSETILIDEGTLVLGTWQGIFLCDFDGPRTRRVHVNVMENS
ncbi:MAG: secondary thiamine-phosphate synthase enzyme YjbQ [Fidelibacterota bacterium]